MPRSRSGESKQFLGDLPVQVLYTWFPASAMTREHPGDPMEIYIDALHFKIGDVEGEFSPSDISEELKETWTNSIQEELEASGPDEDERDESYNDDTEWPE